jgi:hypothetical protein
LVSVAQVTEHSFKTMEEYAGFLHDSGDAALISSRSTRNRENDGLLGWRFGDCHADFGGKVGEPYRGHVHHANKEWKNDLNGKHMILVSDRYLVWQKPVFVSSTTRKQSRYGEDIDASSLRQLMRIGTAE